MPYLPLYLLPIVFLFSWLSPYALSQNTVAECGPSLLPLAPCTPFVQGMAAIPAQACCDSLNQLYANKPACLCLLLHDTSLASSFPIDATLALQLPLLCNLRVDPSTCGGASLASHSPPAQVSSGAKPNSTVAASPAVTAAPRPSFMALGFHHSAELRLKAQGQFFMLLLLAAISTLLTKLPFELDHY